MDIPTKKSSGPLDSANEDAWQAWTQERVSPPGGTGPNFDLDSIQTSQSLPNFQISRSRPNPLDLACACPCTGDCNKECCTSARALLNSSTGVYTDNTPLLSPVKNTSVQRSESPASSYGSTDSGDQLVSVINGAEAVSIHTYVYIPVLHFAYPVCRTVVILKLLKMNCQIILS